MRAIVEKYLKQFWLPVLLLAYILGNMYVLVFKKFYFYPYNALPVILALVYVAVYHLQNLVYVLAFATPLAISLKEMGLTQGPDLSIPSEPIMATIMLMYILNALSSPVTDKKFARHPATLIVAVQLLWMLVTTFTSTGFLISAKYLTSRLWFIFSCYVIVAHLFQDRRNIVRVCFAYGLALAIVVCYATVVHAQFNFEFKAADWVANPFYNDHTAYGAALSMFIPVMCCFLFLRITSPFQKMLAGGLLVMYLAALVLSYARAGWLSVAIAVAVFLTFLFRIRYRTVLLAATTGAVLFMVFQTEIVIALNRINTDSEGGFENNIESVANISTDASNVERLNRWSCAYRMWLDKPVLGWGPGTFAFRYAPYQLSRDLTIISTNFGTGGNAHSEYLGPLSEQGVLGLLLVLALVLYVGHLGYRLVYQLADYDDRILCIGIFLGLITYIVHGFFNNFLDTDKLSFPFWSFLCALVCFDLYSAKKQRMPVAHSEVRP